MDLDSAHVRSLNFGPDTGTVSCQFQQATGKSTMPSISKWSPVIICICLCSIAYCSCDISAHCHLQLSETRAAQQNPLQFPPWSGLVSALSPGPLVSVLSGRSYREGARFFHIVSVKVSVRSNKKGHLWFSAWVDIGGGPVEFLEESCWQWLCAATLRCDLKEKSKNGVLSNISSSGSVSFNLWRIFGEWSKMSGQVKKKWRIFSS